MTRLEKGQCIDSAATTLHPCWEAYHLANKYGGFYSLFPFFLFKIFFCEFSKKGLFVNVGEVT